MSGTPEHVDAEVWDKVVYCFAEALGLDDDEVTWDAKVIDDLGAESLDLLDIVFRLERTFDIKIPRGGIDENARLNTSIENPFEVDGVLTQRGLDGLAEAMPEVPAEELQLGLKAADIPLLFRVATFYRIVVGLMDAKARGIDVVAEAEKAAAKAIAG